MAVGNKFAELQGLNYVPNDAYLQEGFTGSEPLDFSNISSSGIMSQSPIIYPPINQGGGDGGGGPPGPGPGPDLGAVTADDYGYGPVGNMGMTEEEQAGVDSIKNARMSKMDLVKAGLSTMFLGPLAGGSSLYRSQKKAKKEAVAAAKAAQQQRDRDAEVKSIQGRLDSGMSLGDIGRESYTGPGMAFEERDTGTGRGPKKDGGRAGYFFGGRVNYKQGGRINFRGGGMDMGNEKNQAQSAAMGNTTVSNNNNDGGNDNPPNFFVEDKTSIIDTSGLKSKSPEINIDYTDPRNYASLKSKIYNKNILDNDDINVDGTLSGEIGPVSYNTNFTDQGITGTDLTAGNFNADIDANKNYSIGYANNYNGIDYGTTYDSNGNLMFNAGVKFKNGGLAGLL